MNRYTLRLTPEQITWLVDLIEEAPEYEPEEGEIEEDQTPKEELLSQLYDLRDDADYDENTKDDN